MSLAIYDEALASKLKNWTEKSDIQIYTPEEAKTIFEVHADRNNDKPIKLPLICISRDGAYSISNTQEEPLSYDGMTLDADTEKSIQLNAIPISFKYYIDVYARYLRDADEIVRNLVFNLINFSTISAKIVYNNMEIVQDSSLIIDSQVQDNSRIPERFVKGQFSKLTIGLSINNAYLWDIRVRDNYSIDAQIQTN